jgi:hypothetical protein
MFGGIVVSVIKKCALQVLHAIRTVAIIRLNVIKRFAGAACHPNS